MFFLGKYATASTFFFPMVKRGVVDLASSGDWTPSTVDCRLTKDGSSAGPSTNAVANVEGPTWKLALSATEMTAAEVTVQIVDAATKAVEDQWFNIYTYGNASARLLPDFSDAVRFGLTALPNAVAGGNGGLPLGDASARVDVGKLLGTAWATPATAGLTDVNVKNINAVSASPVTTIKAVQGLTTADVVASVTGAVGSVTGAVGSVGSGGIAAASFAAGAIDASAIATDAIGSAEIAATAATEIATAVAAIILTEPTAVTAASPTLQAGLAFIHSMTRNQIRQVASSQTLYADDSTTVIATSTQSDDATTFSKGKFA